MKGRWLLNIALSFFHIFIAPPDIPPSFVLATGR